MTLAALERKGGRGPPQRTIMNIENAGAPTRQKLSLNFAGKARPGREAATPRSATLSTLELRRLVAAMVD